MLSACFSSSPAASAALWRRCQRASKGHGATYMPRRAPAARQQRFGALSTSGAPAQPLKALLARQRRATLQRYESRYKAGPLVAKVAACRRFVVSLRVAFYVFLLPKFMATATQHRETSHNNIYVEDMLSVSFCFFSFSSSSPSWKCFSFSGSTALRRSTTHSLIWSQHYIYTRSHESMLPRKRPYYMLLLNDVTHTSFALRECRLFLFLMQVAFLFCPFAALPLLPFSQHLYYTEQALITQDIGRMRCV